MTISLPQLLKFPITTFRYDAGLVGPTNTIAYGALFLNTSSKLRENNLYKVSKIILEIHANHRVALSCWL